MHDRGKKSGAIFAQRLARTSRPIGLVLMDQGVVSGIGNVYRAEILFRHRLDPYLSANSLDAELVHRLWKDWGVLLARGVQTGVMMTRDDLDAKGKALALEERGERYFVYGRQGQPCRVCRTPIVMAMMATRKLYFCPQCQTSIGRSS
jgi:endonuclease VIII